MNEAIEALKPTPDEDGRFRVTDINTATWAMGKLADIERRREEIADAAVAQAQAIKEWADGQMFAIEGDREFFAGLLREWQQQRLADGLDPKVALPNGRVSTKRVQPKIVWDDVVALRGALVELDEGGVAGVPLRKADKVELDKDAAKGWLKIAEDGRVLMPSGEEAPGCHAEPGGVEFTWKPA